MVPFKSPSRSESFVVMGGKAAMAAVGFEQMQRGALGTHWSDRPTPFDRFDEVMHAVQGRDESPFAAQYFGGAGRQYAEKYGTAPETFAKISVKARKHAANNPYAVFRDQVTVEEAFGMIKTRLTEVPAGRGATIDMRGKAIKVRREPRLAYGTGTIDYARPRRLTRRSRQPIPAPRDRLRPRCRALAAR
jgi:acetyl-CoA acetyltransferase